MKPIFIWTIAAILLGTLIGAWFGPEAAFLGQISTLVIQGIKLFAVPLLFFTITSAVVETEIPKKYAFRLIQVSLINALCALGIALGLFTLFRKSFTSIELHAIQGAGTPYLQKIPDFSISKLMPQSLIEPWSDNDILKIAILALLLGWAIRKSNLDQACIGFLKGALKVSQQILKIWIVLIPVAVLGAIAKSVGLYGFSPFLKLGLFTLACLLGFVLQIGVVYQFWIFKVARHSFKKFWRTTLPTLGTAFGTNSSLATLPLTLETLEQLKVSRRSSSLGAGVATNLNNDGILLYEAFAALFVASLIGVHLDPITIGKIFLFSWIGAVGIAGVPEAGLVSLAMVLTATGLPAEALPLLLTVDWILARSRSVVNVLSDMTLSISLDQPLPNMSQKDLV